MKFGVLSVTSREYIPDTYVSLYCYSFCYESQCLNFWVLILISVSFKRTFNCVRTHVAFTASLYNFISLLLSCRIGWLLSNWRLTISPWLTVSCLQTTTHHQTKKTTTLSVRYIVMFNGVQLWPLLFSLFLCLYVSFKLWIY